ncbi:MAG: hypothetical protein ACO1O1_15125 [Adhaeribacter sp.]
MKKIVLTLALAVQGLFVLAVEKQAVLVQPIHENVKMFQQAGTSSPVVQVLNSSDKITFVRRLNQTWDLVVVNDKPGYVLRSEIMVVEK